MAGWAFYEYFKPDGSSPIRDWRIAQDDEVRAALYFTTYQLAVIKDWLNPERKQFSMLEREHAGLGELRFWTVETKSRRGRKFRVAGLYDPDRQRFIMLTGAEKKLRGSIYIPMNAFNLALKLRRDFEAGKGTIREYDDDI